MAWQLVGSQGTTSLVLPCTPKLWLQFRAHVVMLLPILTGAEQWKKNMLPF